MIQGWSRKKNRCPVSAGFFLVLSCSWMKTLNQNSRHWFFFQYRKEKPICLLGNIDSIWIQRNNFNFMLLWRVMATEFRKASDCVIQLALAWEGYSHPSLQFPNRSVSSGNNESSVAAVCTLTLKACVCFHSVVTLRWKSIPFALFSITGDNILG